MNPEEILRQAQAAIQRGADPTAVNARIAQATGGQFADVDALRAAAQPAESGPAAPRSSVARDLPAALMQGITLGGSDELRGAIEATGALLPGGRSPGEAYREGVEAERARLGQFRKDHPVGARVAEFAGAALPTVAAAATGVGAPASIGRLVALGAAEGAVAGGLSAEGGVNERVGAALLGGGVGAGLGLATPAAGGVARRVMDVVGRPSGRSAVSRAAQTVLRTETPEQRATGHVVEALEAGNVTPAELARRAASAGPGERVIDVGGRGVARLGRAVESFPGAPGGRIASTLEARGAARPERIRQALQKDSGLSFEDAVETADNLAASKRSAAAPLYEKAYQAKVPTDSFVKDLSLPAFRRAWERGRQIAAVEGINIPALPKEVPAGAAISVRGIDYMKRGLDDLIESRMRGGKMGRTEARALRGRLRDILREVDEMVPDYKAARAQFAGDAAMESAFNAGRAGSRELGLKRFLREDPRRVRKVLSDMTPGERDMYRRGALDDVRSALEGPNADSRFVRKFLADADMQARLRLIFPDEQAFNRFRRDMLSEQRMLRTERFVPGGSPTARIQAEQQALTGRGLGDILSPRTALNDVTEAAFGPRRKSFQEETVARIGEMLMDEAGAGFGDDLEAFIRAQAAQAARRRALVGFGGAAAGLTVGHEVAGRR